MTRAANIPPCRICGNGAGNREHRFREMMFGTGEEFLYLECGSCGCLQIAEIPPDLGRFYGTGHAGLVADPQILAGSALKRLLRRLRDLHTVTGRGTVGSLLGLLQPPMPALQALARLHPPRTARILDVGCGSGYFLWSLYNAGFRNLLGIDPYLPEEKELAPGLVLLKKELADVAGEWDIITFIDSFEHVPDPQTSLQAAAERLGGDGWILIRTPVVPCEAFRRYGEHWVQADAPRHLHIPSIRAMEHLAASSGLTLEHVVYDSTDFQFWGSEQYRREVPLVAEDSYFLNPARSIFTPDQIRHFVREADDLNRRGEGDSAVFYLRRTVPGG
ncbi:MAG: putative methyltransferase [Armatimonadota bacterium]|nr:MAG: putative methyltransferase [Armatimonadota bacterium]